MNFLIQTVSFAALDTYMYSNLVVELVVVSYLKLFQLTTPSFRVK